MVYPVTIVIEICAWKKLMNLKKPSLAQPWERSGDQDGYAIMSYDDSAVITRNLK